MKLPTSTIAFIALSGALLIAIPALGQPEYRGHTGNHVQNLTSPTAANNFPDIKVGFSTEPFAETGGTENQIVCLVTARLMGVKVTPSGVTLGGSLVSLSQDAGNLGVTIGNLPGKTRPFAPDGRFSWGFPDLSSDFSNTTDPVVGVVVEGSVSGTQPIDFLKVQCRGQNRLKCTKTGTRACVLAGNRFKVNMITGGGATVSVTANGDNSATFSNGFVAKVLNGCNSNDHFQVEVDPKGSGATITLIVEDTQTGEVVSYMNPGKKTTDKAAFATCP